MFKEGIWYVYSDSDPRWNKKGEGMVGMYDHSQAYYHVEEMRATLGEPPEDLVVGYHKY